MVDERRLVTTFLELCSVDSEPCRERLMADHLIALLKKLGFEVVEDDAGGKTGGNAGNLTARLAGNEDLAPVLFCCHMDRVVPGMGVKPRREGDLLVGDGTTVLGADDASGLAAILEAVAVLTARGGDHPPIELVFTVAEELSLLGSGVYDLSRLSAPYCFVLDASGSVGEIVLRAPEHVKFRAVFHGCKAHAGFVPEQGISAIQMAAAAIGRMELLRIDVDTTANIGSISASGPTNIVPDRCEILGEARSVDRGKLERHLKRLTGAMEQAASEFGGKVEITLTTCYKTYTHSEEAPVVQRAARAAAALGVPVVFKATGGGSDANIFNDRGLPTVVLSCGYQKAHTTEESLPVDQLVRLAQWTLAIIEDR
ncbi:M20/M25/M40 family metallo-hydrolase [Geomonas sp. Red32]|uniref:M20/M25/M40 family metallo-hydrolase n=1 Tax=Geomonas sp. Red32 TaxID=2912856 RepID=UPI00202CFC6E|nr:M20/M25/M40 family metallo-hydrolase [Geomonas sp. Red32]MCM0083558.1 M20/M25/M40 family metallo-hydrolase [Geomonas sp. Red32]